MGYRIHINIIEANKAEKFNSLTNTEELLNFILLTSTKILIEINYI